MKTPAIIPSILFAATLSVPFGAYAVDFAKEPATETPVANAPAKGMNPCSCSHMEEKCGTSAKADHDRSRHLHPRDGK